MDFINDYTIGVNLWAKSGPNIKLPVPALPNNVLLTLL